MSKQDDSFPDPKQFDDQGLIAIGGDLSPPRLLKAYCSGIFPWYEPGQPILWWSPNPRMILLPDSFKRSRSLKKSLKKPFCFTVDSAFPAVIHACATTSDRTHRTWITPEMINAYIKLHELGYAHSVEVWQDTKLVGGLYGLSLGGVFFGESMFHKVRDTSKLAFSYLSQLLKIWNFDFIDCQLPTHHLSSLGATIISRHDYLAWLNNSLKKPTRIGSWKNDAFDAFAKSSV
nr:leucyl/phenylalanyl-tRNA--protein transferase [Legionella impletisoli]